MTNKQCILWLLNSYCKEKEYCLNEDKIKGIGCLVVILYCYSALVSAVILSFDSRIMI